MEIEYSLSALLEIADRWFKTLFSGFDFWWKAEILKIQQKGKNVYAEMVEYDSEGKIAARVKGCIFDEKIYKKFLQETKIGRVEDMTGLKILFHGRFSFHKDYNFSIVIDELSSEYTLGHLQKKQDDILMQLQKLGIVHQNKSAKRLYPPYTIAVISADKAAGLNDFYAVLEQSDYKITYKEYLCAMHGNNAIEQVREQLSAIHASITSGEKIDAVAIIRGGGESSGIVRQSDLEIAKSICLMPVPVMVAIGHTQDTFVIQDLAWYGAKTPTDAAYKITEMLNQREENLDVLYDSVVSLSEDKLIVFRDNIDLRQEQIAQQAFNLLQRIRLQTDSRYNTIKATSPQKLIQSGYALLMQEGNYMTKEQISSLEIWDDIHIQVYDQQLSAKITKKK